MRTLLSQFSYGANDDVVVDEDPSGWFTRVCFQEYVNKLLIYCSLCDFGNGYELSVFR